MGPHGHRSGLRVRVPAASAAHGSQQRYAHASLVVGEDLALDNLLRQVHHRVEVALHGREWAAKRTGFGLSNTWRERRASGPRDQVALEHSSDCPGNRVAGLPQRGNRRLTSPDSLLTSMFSRASISNMMLSRLVPNFCASCGRGSGRRNTHGDCCQSGGRGRSGRAAPVRDANPLGIRRRAEPPALTAVADVCSAPPSSSSQSRLSNSTSIAALAVQRGVPRSRFVSCRRHLEPWLCCNVLCRHDARLRSDD